MNATDHSTITTSRSALSRRGFMTFGSLALSAGALALLGGQPRLAIAAERKAGGDKHVADDVGILNSALAAELEAVAAYEVGARSGLLQKPALDLALLFQGHHKAHAEALAGTVTRLGGKAVAAKPQYSFPTETLKNQEDVLRFAAGLEQGAVGAYLGAVPVFADRELARVAASILGDEAMHWAILRQAVGEQPVPGAFVG